MIGVTLGGVVRIFALAEQRILGGSRAKASFDALAANPAEAKKSLDVLYKKINKAAKRKTTPKVARR